MSRSYEPFRYQPIWPENEPDKITDIEGGFFDGRGVIHLVPARLKGRKAIAVKEGGKWWWTAEV